MYASVDPHLEYAAVLTPRGRRRNLESSVRVRFLGSRPSHVEFLERLLRGWTERRDSGKLNQVGKPIVVLIEKQLDRITVETISLFLLSHWTAAFLFTPVQIGPLLARPEGFEPPTLRSEV